MSRRGTDDHDPYGHVVAVRDGATGSAYWRLTDVDSAGRFREEAFGNGVVTERSYYADKQRLRSIVTRSGQCSAAATGRAEQRYHVHAPERVVAIVTRGGAEEGARYVHVDNLGSVDALTDERDGLVERRSYDPFGQHTHAQESAARCGTRTPRAVSSRR